MKSKYLTLACLPLFLSGCAAPNELVRDFIKEHGNLSQSGDYYECKVADIIYSDASFWYEGAGYISYWQDEEKYLPFSIESSVFIGYLGERAPSMSFLILHAFEWDHYYDDSNYFRGSVLSNSGKIEFDFKVSDFYDDGEIKTYKFAYQSTIFLEIEAFRTFAAVLVDYYNEACMRSYDALAGAKLPTW